uniref:Uncharacterized protein n=1 Tax=Anguilla anguilla TaxID=7936 RepID=A0A0E9QA31_ANGAN
MCPFSYVKSTQSGGSVRPSGTTVNRSTPFAFYVFGVPLKLEPGLLEFP